MKISWQLVQNIPFLSPPFKSSSSHFTLFITHSFFLFNYFSHHPNLLSSLITISFISPLNARMTSSTSFSYYLEIELLRKHTMHTIWTSLGQPYNQPTTTNLLLFTKINDIHSFKSISIQHKSKFTKNKMEESVNKLTTSMLILKSPEYSCHVYSTMLTTQSHWSDLHLLKVNLSISHRTKTINQNKQSHVETKKSQKQTKEN